MKVTAKSNVFEDNNGALAVATLPRITPQSKFFAVKLHFFHEHVKNESNPQGEIHIHKVDTQNQLGDIMTKGLVEDKSPIISYSKRQNTVEESSFGSEFGAMKTAVEQIEGL